MARLPRISARQVIAALRKAGFVDIRSRGSHHFFQHADGRATVIPVHSRETIGPGLMRKILRDCELTSEQFIALL
jgi:predicted RNA binding protein YcfA (HicA-like mRNA interferase family)